MAAVVPDSQKSTLRYGQKYDAPTGIGTTFTEQDMQIFFAVQLLGDPNVEITPTDRNSSLVRTYTIPSADILAFSQKWPETSSIDLPATLDSLTMVYETNSGEGATDETATGASVGTNPNLSLALNGSAQSSAAIIPDLQVVIKPHALSDVPIIKVVFYLAEGDDMADILIRLTAIMGATVNAWPKFDHSLESHVFTLKGQQASVSAGATVKQSVSLGDTDTTIISTGTSDSYQLGNSIKTITTPPTIHGAIMITSDSSTASVDAVADVAMDSGTNWPAQSSSKTASASVAASVTPDSVSATSPVSAIPSSGLYLYKLSGEMSPYAGYNLFYAIIFDFANAS